MGRTMTNRGRATDEQRNPRPLGTNGAGGDRGPPLVHDIYNPGHHADAAFFFAVKRGVRGHHWAFGDMPPMPQVAEDDIYAIVRYIRELQEENGIFYKPHRM